MYGFTLILTLAVVGGVIAYIGDRLGMNVGRKKLTLFGLRPKHTSMLVTIVTGVLIASASIGVLTIASQDVRTALFRMKEIQNELSAMQRDFVEMKTQRDNAQRELLEAEEQVQLAMASYGEVITDLELAEREVEHQKAAMEENQKIISQMETSLAELLAEASNLQAEVSKLKTETEELREENLLFTSAFDHIRESNIAFNASEVILTTVLKQGLSRQEIRARLEEFLKQVDDVAYRRSARVTESQEPYNYKAIYLQGGILDLAVEHIYLTHGDVIVRAVSEKNTIPGVPVVVYLENYLDQMIFSRGTTLTSTTWNPRSGVGIDQLILEMLKDAQNIALGAGMAISEERGISVLLPGDDFLDAIELSRQFRETVDVRLVVSRDTWRSTTPVPVNLEIVAKP